MGDQLINLCRRSVEDGNRNVGTNLKYRKEIKAYCHWVNENRALGLGLPANRHTNETTIRAYWNEKMLNRSCKGGETAKQTRQALNQLIKWECDPDGLYSLAEKKPLSDDINFVIAVLNDKARDAMKEKDSDPDDDNPTDTLSAPELELVMHELLAAKDKNADWKNRGIVWSICSNTMIRWNSALCLCLPNMFIHKKLPRPHGIVQEHDCMPPTHLCDSGWMLCFLIPPLDQKKKNKLVAKLKTEAVGAAFHHKHFSCCMVGLMSWKLFDDLNQVIDISFFDESPEGFTSWGKVHLFEETYMTTNCNMKEDMLKVNVVGGREVTHLRKCAIALCTAQGLSEDVLVSTMSKYRDNHFQKSYRSEISAPVATTLQGFLPNASWDNYYVPSRAHLELPHQISNKENFTKFVLWL